MHSYENRTAAERPHLTAQYEALRAAAFGEPVPPDARAGLALLLRRGLHAWVRAAVGPSEPPRPARRSSAQPLADADRCDAVRLLAAMAMGPAERRS